MSTRTAVAFACSLWALSVILAGFDFLGSVMTSATPSPTTDAATSQLINIVINVLASLMILAFMTVGALIIARCPENPIGWLLCAGALSDNVRGAGQAYAWFAFARYPGALPGGVWGLWLALEASATTAGWFVFVFLLFPNGRLPSPRWRPVAWSIAGVMVATMLTAAVAPWPPEALVGIGNPHNPLERAGAFGTALQQLFPILEQLQLVCLMLAAALFGQMRFRHAQGSERQQLKWITSAVAFVSIVAFAFWLPGGWAWASSVAWGYLAELLYVLAFTAVPVSIGVAIFKHRLYDIDLIIRHTLIYSALTALLLLVYFVSVVLLQFVFRGLIGQAQNPFVTVFSTLIIAALFTPLRGFVQTGIDRRFYRHKYDAEKILAAFGVTVRDETNLDKLAERLVAVAEETMQPAQVSLWLRKPEREVKR